MTLKTLPNTNSTSLLCAATTLLAAMVVTCPAAETKPVFTDSSITTAVDSDLWFTKGVSPYSIDVSTNQGIVTLSGSTDNLMSKERAVTVAASIRGVRGVIDRIAVTPVSRPDEDIRKNILTALFQDPATESYQVAVSVKDAVASLTGSVGSRAESQLAARIAKGVKGLKEIRNELIVNYAARRTDAEIAADVKAELQWDIWVNGDLINSSVKDGKVTLSGATGSAVAEMRAVDDAWVNGVSAVDDSGLKVEPWANDEMRRKNPLVIKSDSEIQQAIEASLHRDPRVSSFAPNVRVEDGVVILSGAIGNLKARAAAQRDARDTVGVWSVDNLLKVRPNHTAPAAELEADLKAALQWDPLLTDTKIEAAVIGRVAYLSGGVADSFQRSEAGDVASRTKGVGVVVNHLKVEPEYSVYDYAGPYSYYDWPYSDEFVERFGPVPPESDEEIKKSIERAFFWSPFVRSADIQVTVHGGVATLSGKVGSWIGWGEADRDAHKIGATAVIDLLTVNHSSWF
jgi:osmotically-inducible protein OsmY